jgi:flagellar hook-associated protein 1 FlgK
VIGGELARVNLRLTRAGAGSSDRAALLDQRDTLLERMSGIANITTTFAADGGVTVRLGSSTGPVFVSGGDAGHIGMSTAANGTISFDMNGAPLSLSGGSLSGGALALSEAAGVRGRLDAIADSLSTAVNDVQTNGSTLAGTPGQPLFAGSGAAGIRLVETSGSALATAAAGQPAGSRDGSNLSALRQSLATSNPAGDTNDLLFDISARVQSRTLTHEALDTITASARLTLEQQAGVDLDTEATNLIRFQQAFQASSRAMQVATELFDTLLGIG